MEDGVNETLTKAIIWDRYKQGDSLQDIARMFDRYHSSIMPTIHQTGGYHPLVRKRHRLALSHDESEKISRWLVAKISISAISNKLSKGPLNNQPRDQIFSLS